MNYQESLTIITFVFLLLAAVNLIRCRQKYQLIQKEYLRLSQKNSELSEKHFDLQTKISELGSFENNLSNAEMTTRLQTSRTGYHSGETNTVPPEKYCYINALTKSGMDAEKIADLLSISLQEAEQLVNLSQIVHR